MTCVANIHLLNILHSAMKFVDSKFKLSLHVRSGLAPRWISHKHFVIECLEIHVLSCGSERVVPSYFVSDINVIHKWGSEISVAPSLKVFKRFFSSVGIASYVPNRYIKYTFNPAIFVRTFGENEVGGVFTVKIGVTIQVWGVWGNLILFIVLPCIHASMNLIRHFKFKTTCDQDSMVWNWLWPIQNGFDISRFKVILRPGKWPAVCSRLFKYLFLNVISKRDFLSWHL